MHIAQNIYTYRKVQIFCLVLASGKMWKIVCVFTGIVIPGILFLKKIFFFAQEVYKLVVFLSQALYCY